MPEKRPEYLKQGDRARLIPVASSGEVQATSVFLSVMSAVKEFSDHILGGIGVRTGKRTEIEVYTEVVFKKTEKATKVRPDGLLIVRNGKKEWRALIEAKIGKSELQERQIKDYLWLAKENKIDAVITLSNQYSALPTHHPVSLKKSDLNQRKLFHFSWMFLMTEAIVLLKNMGVEDQDQQFILSEMVRYFQHDKINVSNFDRMNSEWKQLVSDVRSGARLTKNSPEVVNSVTSWHQEARDLCIIMSQTLAAPVSLKLSRKHMNDSKIRHQEDCEQLIKSKTLSCVLDIPDAASPLEIEVDLMRRTITCLMKINDPKKKKQAKGKVNWVVRQINKDIVSDEFFIRSYWPGRAAALQASLPSIREDSSVLFKDYAPNVPTSFAIFMVRDLAGKFSGSKTFIQSVEGAVLEFYAKIGQDLRQPVYEPPQVKTLSENKPVGSDEDEQPVNEDRVVSIEKVSGTL